MNSQVRNKDTRLTSIESDSALKKMLQNLARFESLNKETIDNREANISLSISGKMQNAQKEKTFLERIWWRILKAFS